MSSFIRTVNKQEIKSNRYSILGFTRNPFPRKPSITINSSDDRENGSIYIPELRESEIKDFDKIVIPQKGGHEPKNITFLMDHASRQGRGIGKTSFLNYQLNRVNQDLGDFVSKGAEVLFAIYCSPIPGENYKKFYSFSRLVVKALIDQNILATALCRIRVLSNLIPSKILKEVNDQNLLSTVGNSKWLQDKAIDNKLSHEFDEYHLNMGVKRILEEEGINNKFAERFARFGTSNTEISKYYFDELKEMDWRRFGNSFLFNDLVLLLQAAGFTKGIILFDETEKIIQPQNSQDRRSFCEELRYWFIDGDNTNASTSFFNILLVIHPYIQELLNPHWSASGLERFSSLGGHFDDQSTIFFRPIKEQQAIPLAIEYMDRSRLDVTMFKSVVPFDNASLETALIKSFNVPGKFLSFLHQLVEKAVENGWDKIDKQKVEQLSLANTVRDNYDDDTNAAGINDVKVKI
jgi:hypothetical protein